MKTMPDPASHKAPKFAIVIGAIAAFYTVAVLAAYVLVFQDLTISRSDAGPWGQFGDYVGGLLNPAFALLNVILVGYIAISFQRLNEKERTNEQEYQKRIQATIDLHREWNGESMYSSRMKASPIARKHLSLSLFEIEKIEPYEQAAHIWVVVGFFHRMNLLVQHERLQKEMAIKLFGELFVWWWTVSFEKQLSPCNCDSGVAIEELKRWFYTNTTETEREPWVARAHAKLTPKLVENDKLLPSNK